MPSNADTETFCIYCQREYGTPKKLKAHVLKKHPDTYRSVAYLDASRTAEYVCAICGKPVDTEQGGGWGHTFVGPGILRFWCGPDHDQIVRPVASIEQLGDNATQ